MMFSTFLWLSIIFAASSYDQVNGIMTNSEFCYNRPDCGPSTWEGVCRTGVRQSPIAITYNANTPIIYPENPIKFSRNYVLPQTHFYIQDNGHTVQVHLENSANYSQESPFFVEGPEGLNQYVLAQIHLHWGSNESDVGSEHSLNGREHPMEIHMVHYSTKYQNLADALENGPDNAVTVFGIFVDIGPETNPALSSFSDGVRTLLSQNIEVGQVVRVEKRINLSDLFTTDSQMQVFRYDGSLTTPPCTEKVQWVVFKEPITVSARDIKEFEDLADLFGEKLINNFRPLQPLAGRKVEFHQLR